MLLMHEVLTKTPHWPLAELLSVGFLYDSITLELDDIG